MKRKKERKKERKKKIQQSQIEKKINRWVGHDKLWQIWIWHPQKHIN